MAMKSVASVAARRRARELAARFQERELLLLRVTEEFFAAQEWTSKTVEGIDRQIARLEEERERVRRVGWEASAVVAGRMRELGAREAEVAQRLGVALSEARRLLAWSRGVGVDGGVKGKAQPGQRVEQARAVGGS